MNGRREVFFEIAHTSTAGDENMARTTAVFRLTFDRNEHIIRAYVISYLGCNRADVIGLQEHGDAIKSTNRSLRMQIKSAQ